MDSPGHAIPFCDQAYVVDESDVKVRFENVSKIRSQPMCGEGRGPEAANA